MLPAAGCDSMWITRGSSLIETERKERVETSTDGNLHEGSVEHAYNGLDKHTQV